MGCQLWKSVLCQFLYAAVTPALLGSYFLSLNLAHIFTYEMPLANFEQVKLTFMFYRSYVIATISMPRIISVILSTISLSTCKPSSQSLTPRETTQNRDSRILGYYNVETGNVPILMASYPRRKWYSKNSQNNDCVQHYKWVRHFNIKYN